MKYLGVFLGFISVSSLAAISSSQWQCLAFDQQEKGFEAYGATLNDAKQAAKHRCQQESDYKKSCKSAESFCEKSHIPDVNDECVVSDSQGRIWTGKGKDSCKIAMENCSQWEFLHGKQSPCTVKHNEDNDN